MDIVPILWELAVIIAAAKLMGLLARAMKAPQVAGEIVAGLLVGPSLLNLVQPSDFLSVMAELGVILLMFSAGLGTNLKELMRTGPKALAIASLGVAVPLALGTVLYMVFYGFAGPGSDGFVRALFVGTILTATSVSITVAALKELGKLQTEVGTAILSAAIIDDVIGIILLTFVQGMKDTSASPVGILLKTGLFFAVSIVVGYIVYRVFRWADTRWPHTQRISIMGLAFCFFLAWAAERWFGIADITGAYVAGVVLCSLQDSGYIESKMNVDSYTLFGPLFFASIGVKTSMSGFTPSILLFSAAFVVVGLLGKVIGCGLCSRVLGYSRADSLKIGVGMMTRGEVALIVAQKGMTAGLVDPVLFAPVILLIILSSIITPILLKQLYAKEPATPTPAEAT